MWRNLIFVLLLANLLLFAWQRWIVPPRVENPAAYSEDAAVPQLVLVKPATERPAMARPAPADTGQGCLRVGPFAAGAAADAAARKLSGRGLRVSRVSEATRVWAGHWVQLVEFESVAAAQQTLQTLAAGGLKDAYLVQREPTINVSLGVFRQREGADGVIERARRLGMEPVTVDRYRAGFEHWLVVATTDNDALKLDELDVASEQILRVRQSACQDDEGDGSGAGDSLEFPESGPE